MFLETICIKNGIVRDIEAHQARMCDTALRFGFPVPELPDLSAQVPTELRDSQKVSVAWYTTNRSSASRSPLTGRKD